jgi:hypothetical protein
MNSKNFDKEFERVYQSVSDAYDQRFIDGDTYDQIGNAMCELYPEAAKKVAIANGDMSADDPIELASASIPELYEVVHDKEQFINELDSVFHLISKYHYTSELVQELLDKRST